MSPQDEEEHEPIIDNMVAVGVRIFEAEILIKGIKKEYVTALEQFKAEVSNLH